MARLLLDGSNVALSGVAKGQRSDLVRLTEVISGLIEHGHEPFTIFDASFKWRLPEGSAARSEFDHLTKQVVEYFVMAPSGEKADLFLLEYAKTLDAPILSNDVFREYGKLKNDKLEYKGARISVFNFSVFAGALIIPDLEISWKITPPKRSLKEIAVWIEDNRTALDAVELPTNGSQPAAPAAPAAKTEPEHERSAPEVELPELEQEKVSAIARVIKRTMATGQRSVDQLAGRLRDHRRNYQKVAGLGDKNKKRWFGYPSLDEFIRQRLPQFRVKNGKIEDPDAGPKS